MAFFNSGEPMLRRKQRALDVQDLCGLWRWRWCLGKYTVLDTHFTRIDQVFLLWAAITGGIFFTAQWVPMSWSVQILLWSGLTGVGLSLMSHLVWFWVQVEQLRWLVYSWTGLMLVGLAVTAHGVFNGNPWVLSHLCELWLGVCALGYGVMGVGMRSQSFLLAALVHGVTVPFLGWLAGWQFFTTGWVMSGCLMLFACVQWDMRAPVAPARLSEAEKVFNRHQAQLRKQ
jgi:hypothetical protein